LVKAVRTANVRRGYCASARSRQLSVSRNKPWYAWLMSGRSDIEELYRQLIACWNERDAVGFGRLFQNDGSMVGFDGSCVEGSAAITEHLAGIFGDHETASYVSIVRETRGLAEDVALLRAVAGMSPPGGSDLVPGANAVQSLIAVRTGDGWRIAHYHNTPAAFHGRPEEAEALTAELRSVISSNA
jgi:uncharacterized protein (TIGR02246 family)